MSRFSKPLSALDVSKLPAAKQNRKVSDKRELEDEKLVLPDSDAPVESSEEDILGDIDEDYGKPDAPESFSSPMDVIEDESNYQ